METTATNTIPTHCPLCAATEVEATGDTHTDERVYTLYICTNCFVQFWWPLQNPGGAWYEHDERYADRNKDPILTPNIKHTDVIGFLPRKGNVLDIGCGVGNFLAYAQKHGWEGWGIDFDRDAIRSAQDTFHLRNVSVASLHEFALHNPQRRFELITFFDVFEHIDDHNQFLELTRSLLTDDGHIALSVPYRHAWRWLMPADVPPRHLTRWDETALTKILTRHGFTTVRLRRLPASIYYIALKLRFRYGGIVSFNLVNKVRTQARSENPQKEAAHVTRLQYIQILAKIKDLLIFGLPALAIWLVLLPTRMRYTDVWLVAQKSH